MRVCVFAAAVGVALLSLSTVSLASDAPRTFDKESWQELTQAHKDRPLIVHFWGLTCSNCMAELKDWGAFVREHPDANVVLVNWDRRSATPERIVAALAKAGLGGAQNLALSNGFEDKLRFAVDRDWMGELPYTRLIARDGTATTFSGAADFAKLDAWLSAQR